MKTCPKCGGNKFKAYIKKGAVIEIKENEVVSLREGGKFSYEITECLSCNTKLTNNDLVEKTVPCTKCGKDFNSDELKDGLCPLCSALEKRPELAEASKEDLLLKLLEVERQLSMTKSIKIDTKLEKAEEAEASVKEKEVAATEDSDKDGKEISSKRKRKTKAQIEAEQEESGVEVEPDPKQVAKADTTEQEASQPDSDLETESEKHSKPKEQKEDPVQNLDASSAKDDEEIVDPFGPSDDDDDDDEDDDDEPSFNLGDEPF